MSCTCIQTLTDWLLQSSYNNYHYNTHKLGESLHSFVQHNTSNTGILSIMYIHVYVHARAIHGLNSRKQKKPYYNALFALTLEDNTIINSRKKQSNPKGKTRGQSADFSIIIIIYLLLPSHNMSRK